MSVDTMELFFAVLTLAALVGIAGLVGARLLRGRVALADTVLELFGDNALWLAWLVGVTATVGSLYFSEVANFTPCTLCWYQRIAIYPMAVVLLIAALRRDRGYWQYAVPVLAIGAAVSTYHFVIELFPKLDAGACSAAIPCTFVWFRELGFITLPFMALTATVFMIVLLTVRTKETA